MAATHTPAHRPPTVAHTAMKIFSIAICRPALGSGGEEKDGEPVIMSQAFNVGDFNFFQRGSVKQFLTAFTRIFVKRTATGKRLACEHEGHVVHTWTFSSGVSGCAVCDQEYPSRVAFTLIKRLVDEFLRVYPSGAWAELGEKGASFEPINTYIVEYQDPQKVDKITKIQKELDSTMDVMHETIDKVLERGVKLDDLVERSADLSSQSKMFYKTAKSHNRCCIVM